MNSKCGGSRLPCCATGIPLLLWISAPRQQTFCAPESTSACTPSRKAAERVCIPHCCRSKERVKEYFMRGMRHRRPHCPSAGLCRRQSSPRCKKENSGCKDLPRRSPGLRSDGDGDSECSG